MKGDSSMGVAGAGVAGGMLLAEGVTAESYGELPMVTALRRNGVCAAAQWSRQLETVNNRKESIKASL